jgi:DNA modification methylase
MNPEIEKVLNGESDGCIVCGDCLEVMAGMPDGCVDAVVTDPPYGIGFEYRSYEDTEDAWYELMNAAVPEMRRVAQFVVLPSCAIKRMRWWYATHNPDWLIAWHKGSPGHAAAIGFNDWEPHVCWGRPDRPMHDHFKTVCGFSNIGHPCPKPLEWATWLVERAAPQGGIVLDLFVGSGTTCEAAKRLGRKYIGIEIDEKYCRIARNRVANTEKPLFT